MNEKKLWFVEIYGLSSVIFVYLRRRSLFIRYGGRVGLYGKGIGGGFV